MSLLAACLVLGQAGAAPAEPAEDTVIIIDDDEDAPAEDEVIIVDEEDDAPAEAAEEPVIVNDEGGDGDDTVIVNDEGEDGDDTVIVIEDGGNAEGDAVAEPEEPTFAWGGGGRTFIKVELSSRLLVDTRFEDTRRQPTDATGEDVVEWWNLGRLRVDHKQGRELSLVADAWVRWGVAGRHPGKITPS